MIFKSGFSVIVISVFTIKDYNLQNIKYRFKGHRLVNQVYRESGLKGTMSWIGFKGHRPPSYESGLKGTV